MKGVRLKRLLVTILLGAVGASAAVVTLRSIPISYGYYVEARCVRYPESDHELGAWLSSWPGVVPHTVSVEREGDLLIVGFIQSHTRAGDPPPPILEEQARRLGYGISSAGFDDHPRGRPNDVAPDAARVLTYPSNP